MELVGAGFSYDIHHAAQHGAEFGRVSVGNNFELLNGVNNGRHCVRAQERREVVHAVCQKIVASVGRTVDGRE